MKKLIAVSISLFLVFARQSFGGGISQGLTEVEIPSSDFYAAETPGASSSKVAIVDKSGLHYADPIAAMEDLASWCGTPAEANRCLVRIMPGIYDLGINTLNMWPYVDVEGSGENATKIEGQGSNGVVRVSGNSELRFLTVEHTGGAEQSIAVKGDGSTSASKKLTNVTIVSTKGTGRNHGIYYFQGYDLLVFEPLILKNVTVIASGGSESVGIVNTFLGGVINIYRSSIGGTRSIHGYTGRRTYVYNTVLKGLVKGPVTCSKVYDKDYNFYAKTCP